MQALAGTGRKALLLSTILFLPLLIGCNPYVKTPVPDDLVGKMQFSSVEVDKLPSIHSQTVTEKVKQALVAKIQEKESGDASKEVTLHVTVEEWQSPENLIGGKATAKILGSHSKIKGLVKVTDPSTGVTIAEYRAMADYQEGGLLSPMTTISFNDVEEEVVGKFVYFVLDHLY